MRAWEKNIRRVVPYVPGEQPEKIKMIKLNTNENPYPPAPGVRRAIQDFPVESLRLYPDPTIKQLAGELAKYYHLEDDQVFVGVGSDDVLAVAFMTFFQSDKPVLFPDITYSFYSVWCDLFRIPYERPMLDSSFRINPKDYYKANGGVVIANPNAPTSIYEDLSVIEDILDHNKDCIVIVDEAYIDFAGLSAIELLPRYDNLLVVQTFSKSRSMAGMRIGFACGHPDLIRALNDIKYSINSYTLNRLSIAAGIEAVRDVTYFKECIGRIIATRERFGSALCDLGFQFPKSGSNFIFATHRTLSAVEIYEALRNNDIYVRYFHAPRIDNYIRITIGTDEEMDTMLQFLKDYIKQG